jgi:hypothetical protein
MNEESPSHSIEEQDFLTDRVSPYPGRYVDPSKSDRASRQALWTLLLLLVFTNTATRLYDIPLNRVIEMRLCRDYYTRHDSSQFGPGGSIPEKLCKIDEVQQQLAWLQGIMEATVVTCGEYPLPWPC